MSDATIEQEIQAKGLTAPLVTPQLHQDPLSGAHGYDANGSPVAAEQLSRDLTEQARSESLGG